jgi:hypothetical protein
MIRPASSSPEPPRATIDTEDGEILENGQVDSGSSAGTAKTDPRENTPRPYSAAINNSVTTVDETEGLKYVRPGLKSMSSYFPSYKISKL